MEGRERACDEEVLRNGGEPRAYAEGILKICEAIMTNRVAQRRNYAKKAILAVPRNPVRVNLPLPASILHTSSRIFSPTQWGLRLRTTTRAKLSQIKTLRIYAGKRFVIHAVQADWSRATTAAAVSP